MFHIENDPKSTYIICLTLYTVMAFHNAEPHPNSFIFHPHMVWQGRSLQVVEMNSEVLPFVCVKYVNMSQTSCAYKDILLDPIKDEFIPKSLSDPTGHTFMFLWVLKECEIDLPIEIVEMILWYIVGDTVLTRYTPKQVVPLRGPNVYVAYLNATDILDDLFNVLARHDIH